VYGGRVGALTRSHFGNSVISLIYFLSYYYRRGETGTMGADTGLADMTFGSVSPTFHSPRQ